MNPAAPASPRSAPTAHRLTSPWTPWLFLSPYLLVTLVFFVYPFIGAMRLAFFQTAGPRARAWVGLDNFSFILGDRDFHTAVKNTVTFALANGLIMLPLSLGLALLLNSKRDRLKGFFRLVFFSPNVVGQIFVGIIFSVIFVPRYGLMNVFLQDLVGWGLETRWLKTPELVMPAIIITNLWLYAGFNMVYFLAALQSVDESQVEAARIDGAGPLQVFWHVTLPAIKPVAVFVFVVSTINSFQLFELPFALLQADSNGNFKGPANSGYTIVGYLYDAAYGLGDLGLAAAVGWTLALIMLTVSVAQLKLSGSLREESGSSS